MGSVHHQSILLCIEACPLNRFVALVDFQQLCCVSLLAETDSSRLKLWLLGRQSFPCKQRCIQLGGPCVVLPLHSLVGESKRVCLMFFEPRDLKLHHTNDSWLNHACKMLSELHHHGVVFIPLGLMTYKS